MAVRVGRWDCTYCGYKGNLGPETKCNSCGAPRPRKVRFYLPDDAEKVTDERRIRQAKSGVDWVCSHCGAQNKTWHKQCHSCGNPRSEGDGDTDLKEKVYGVGEVPTSSEDTEHVPAGEETDTGSREARQLSSRASKIRKVVLALLILAGLAFGLTFFNSDVEVEVAGHQWKRIYQISKYVPVEEEGWQVPAGGRETASFQAVHHYNKVSKGFETRTRKVKVKVGEERYVSGKRDLGNGYFEDVYSTRPVYEERSETYQEEVFDNVPVYRTKYRYVIYRWKPDDPLVTAGNDQTPYWPDSPRLEDKDHYRITGKIQEYFLVIKDHRDKLHTEKVSFDLWTTARRGQTVTAFKSAIYNYYKGLKTNRQN